MIPGTKPKATPDARSNVDNALSKAADSFINGGTSVFMLSGSNTIAKESWSLENMIRAKMGRGAAEDFMDYADIQRSATRVDFTHDNGGKIMMFIASPGLLNGLSRMEIDNFHGTPEIMKLARAEYGFTRRPETANVLTNK